MSLLEVKNLRIAFSTDSGTVCAVSGVDFTIEEGDILGLVGETGAGKTTTACGIMRLIPSPPGRIEEGEVLYQGEDLLKKSEREMRKIRGNEISMIFQDPMTALNPIMTVDEQIAEVIVHHNHCSKAEAMGQALAMLEKVGIKAERAHEYPHQFSGGMKQRVVIAIALACNPKLLIADEPTTALDVTIQAQVLAMIRDLQKEMKTAMLLITHDLGIVAETCNRVAVMYAGEILEYGCLEDIFETAAHPYTKGLFSSIPSLDENVRRLTPIPGLMPDPTNLPAGCKFHTRCKYVCEACKTKAPGLTELTPGHYVRCLQFESKETLNG
mgnify:FL=1